MPSQRVRLKKLHGDHSLIWSLNTEYLLNCTKMWGWFYAREEHWRWLLCLNINTYTRSLPNKIHLFWRLPKIWPIGNSVRENYYNPQSSASSASLQLSTMELQICNVTSYHSYQGTQPQSFGNTMEWLKLRSCTWPANSNERNYHHECNNSDWQQQSKVANSFFKRIHRLKRLLLSIQLRGNLSQNCKRC